MASSNEQACGRHMGEHDQLPIYSFECSGATCYHKPRGYMGIVRGFDTPEPDARIYYNASKVWGMGHDIWRAQAGRSSKVHS